MRKQWFGDSRDYVKWSCIRKQAGEDMAVVYAVMLREDSFEDEQLDPHVIRFFDELKDFRAIGKLFSKGFEVFDQVYERQKADKYFAELESLIRSVQTDSPVLVFLDPDTGIEPKICKDEHVRMCDVARLCKCLTTADKLVIYQHARHEKAWAESLEVRLIEEIATPENMTLGETFQFHDIAKDVCFFTLTKK